MGAKYMARGRWLVIVALLWTTAALTWAQEEAEAAEAGSPAGGADLLLLLLGVMAVIGLGFLMYRRDQETAAGE